MNLRPASSQLFFSCQPLKAKKRTATTRKDKAARLANCSGGIIDQHPKLVSKKITATEATEKGEGAPPQELQPNLQLALMGRCYSYGVDLATQ